MNSFSASFRCDLMAKIGCAVSRRPRLAFRPVYTDFLSDHTTRSLHRSSGDSPKTDKDELIQLIESSATGTLWGSPGSAQSDFRSDVVTKPSLRMLKSLIETTLDDDVFREDKTTMQFEREVALMFGYEAGCFVLSGTMANQLALRGLLQQPPYAILCDEKAHIINYEGGGPAFTCSALVQPVAPVNGKYLTVTDIEKHAITSYDVHKCPTQVVCMENTCAGMVVPIRELQEIRKWTEQHGIKTHLDGARIWEALTVDPTLLKRYHDLVDCMTVDFSKGLGAPMGAMILGDSELIRQIRRVRKSVGGGFRQAGVLSSLARAALRENFGERGIERSPLQQVHQIAADVSHKWTSRGGDLLYPVETNQVWVDLEARSIRPDDFKRMGEMHNVILDGPRIVLHHQISQEALRNLDAVFERSFS